MHVKNIYKQQKFSYLDRFKKLFIVLVNDENYKYKYKYQIKKRHEVAKIFAPSFFLPDDVGGLGGVG